MIQKIKIKNKFLLFLVLLLFLFVFLTESPYAFSTSTPVQAQSTLTDWNGTIIVIESGGSSDSLEFGEKTDASNDQDKYDIPEPPFPFQLPYVVAQFETNLPSPYNHLMAEFKHPNNVKNIWNFTLTWASEPGNNTTTTLTLTWEIEELVTTYYNSIQLIHNTTKIANLLSDHEYIIDIDHNEVVHFQILCEQMNHQNNSSPFLPIMYIFISMLCITVYYKKRKKI